MNRRVAAALLSAGWALAGCAPEPAAPAAEAYIVIPARDDATGWAIVEQLGQDLPEPDRKRIGVPTVLSDKSSTMIVPFTGACVADAALVARAAAVALGRGVAGTRCDAAFPG